jgi:hypothetical protein
MTNYDSVNETIRFSVETKLSPETRSALAAFFRRNGYSHVFAETLEPLLSGADVILALATTDRPWPPKGIGSQTIEAVGIAMIGREGRGLLTPVLMDRSHATNLGLAGAVTKQLLENLRNRKVSSAVYLVREGDRVLERALDQAGFVKGDLLTATEYADYREHSAPPAKALKALGLDGARAGDVLSLNLDGQEIDRLGAYTFTLGAGLSPYLWELTRYASLLPGLIDVIADSPPGGVPPGSPGPALGEGEIEDP